MSDHNEGHAENCACLYPGDRECNCHKAHGFPTAEAMEIADRIEAAALPAVPEAPAPFAFNCSAATVGEPGTRCYKWCGSRTCISLAAAPAPGAE